MVLEVAVKTRLAREMEERTELRPTVGGEVTSLCPLKANIQGLRSYNKAGQITYS